MAYSPDGTRIASSGDPSIRIWDARTAKELRVIPDVSADHIAFSPDGKRVAASLGGGYGEDHYVVWESESGRLLWSEKAESVPVSQPSTRWASFSTLGFSPDGKRVVVPHNDKTVRVIDAESGRLLLILLGHEGTPTAASYSPDGRRIVSGGLDGTVRVWDADTGSEFAVIRGQESGVTTAIYSPDGRWIASAGGDGVIRIWNAESTEHEYQQVTRKAEVPWLTTNTDRANSVSSPDGRRVLTGVPDGSARLLDSETGQEVSTLRGHQGPIDFIKFTPDGQRITTGGQDGTVRVWDPETGRELLNLLDPARSGRSTSIEGLALSPDGRQVLATNGLGSVFVWDGTPSGPELRSRREALSLARFHLHEAPSEADYLTRIAKDSLISEEVRTQALQIASVFWGQEASSRSERLNRESWKVVQLPREAAAAYRDALRKAEEACRLRPRYGPYVNTLGVALYRVGLYDKALNTLTQSDELNQGVQPIDLAFLAMCRQKLGQPEAASATLDRLRILMKDGDKRIDGDDKSAFREAELLIRDPAFPADPFAP